MEIDAHKLVLQMIYLYKFEPNLPLWEVNKWSNP